MGFEPNEAFKPTLERFRRFVEDELLPLEPRLLNEGFDAIEDELEAKRAEARQLRLCLRTCRRRTEAWGSRSSSSYLGEILGRTPIGHYAVDMQAPTSAT